MGSHSWEDVRAESWTPSNAGRGGGGRRNDRSWGRRKDGRDGLDGLPGDA